MRRRLLASFVRRGRLESDAAHAMQAWRYDGGFHVDASVRIEDADHAGRERLLRYCARPPFALERLQQRDAEHLLYAANKPVPGDCGPQILTSLQLIDHLAALVSPARVHRHRYFSVLAPHSPLRSAVNARAMPAAMLITTAPSTSVTFHVFPWPLWVDRHVGSGSRAVARYGMCNEPLGCMQFSPSAGT